MHDNFEREVQKKMEELNLTPPVPVWEKIELQIRPEKRKRRMLIWFFLGALILGGGYFSYQSITGHTESASNSGNQTFTNQQPITTNPSPSEPLRTEEKTTPIRSTPNSRSISAQPLTKPQIIIEDSVDSSLNSSVPVTIASAKEKKKRFKRNTGITLNKTAGTKTLRTGITDTPENITAISEENKPLSSSSTTQPALTDTAVVEKQPSIIDSAAKPTLEKTVSPPADSAIRKKVAANTKWKRKIFFAAGISNQIANLGSSTITMDAAIPQNAGGVGANAPSFNPKPANVTPGLGFMIGYELAKKLNEHLELSVGLRYAYYSSQLQIGDSRRRDTAIRYGAGSFATNQYYTNIRRNDYTTHFHTLQVPVTIHYKPSVKVPLYIAAGASYEQVMSTNVLTFSSSSNLYYRNRDNDIRSLLPVHVSVQAGLFEKAKTSVRVGPVVQYNLLKLQKENPSNASHLFFAGLQSTINF